MSLLDMYFRVTYTVSSTSIPKSSLHGQKKSWGGPSLITILLGDKLGICVRRIAAEAELLDEINPKKLRNCPNYFRREVVQNKQKILMMTNRSHPPVSLSLHFMGKKNLWVGQA